MKQNYYLTIDTAERRLIIESLNNLRSNIRNRAAEIVNAEAIFV